MKNPAPPALLGLLEYPGAQAAAVYGLRDLLETANRLRTTRDGGLEVRVLSGKEDPRDANQSWAAIILPPSLGGGDPEFRSSPWVDWIRQCHRAGTLVCSVCVGTFLLAETGLLAGRPATTHWCLKEAFSRRYPAVLLNTDQLVIDDGDLITAGGLMAWVDLGLRLIERLLSPSVMLSTARHFLVDPGGREQRFYSVYSPVVTHGDSAVLKAQRWLQGRIGRKVTLSTMAAQAGLGERTFLRRFRKATGLSPLDYVQHLRVVRARELLESSVLSVEEVARQVGYEDTGALRKVFHRIMGLSPGEYRRRFSSNRQGSNLGRLLNP